MLTDLLILASEGAEGIPGEHIASKLAVPLGIVFFCGGVFLLLWSNYGAKKGALIYSTAMFGFCMMLGVFWWFGAPGTPVATGLQNFPGQAPDAYQSKWYPFEPGSERAEVFPVTNDLDGNFRSAAEYVGGPGATPDSLDANPRFGFVSGSLTQAGDRMMELFMNVQEGEPRLGGERRAGYATSAEEGLAAEVGAGSVGDYDRADPFFTAVVNEDGVRATESQSVLVAGATIQVFANYEPDPEVAPDADAVQVLVDEQVMFAFQQGSNIWFPSAVWTLVSLVLFALSLFGLDRIEQREKRARADEVQEPERLAVPIRQ